MRKNITTKEHGAKSSLSPRLVKQTKEEALRAAVSEAKASGVSPSAVMHSSPDGAVTGDS